MHEAVESTFPWIFNLTGLLPLLPFMAFLLIVLWANHNKKLSAGLAIGGIALSWILGWAIAFTTFGIEGFGEHPFRMFTNYLPTGRTWQAFGFAVDPLTAGMLVMVPFVCFLIFVYAYGYMAVGKPEDSDNERGKPAIPGTADPLASRFFAYIALFATGMLGLVVSDNLIMLMIFWETMGLCSYLLIGFWFARKYPNPKQITPKEAGLKAFLTTGTGDLFLLSGMMLLYVQSGSLSFADVFQKANLEHLASITLNLPIVGAVPWATVIGILIFGGAIGKSAQFPLHTWLPDAMEGPTPVSALIHAATMVSAGVYLIIRTYPIMQAAPDHGALNFIAFIGAFTALFAATIAVAQNDIKKVLAYSTISQLGYMFAALGIGAYVAATFHLLTHAFFKALLFMGSGSVIHGMEHGHHEAHAAHAHGAHASHGNGKPLHGTHTVTVEGSVERSASGVEEFDPQNMRNMGGLFRRMPRTAWTFIIGGLALSGFPIVTAGFWSKDEILASAFGTGHTIVFVTLALAALLTAFYTGRQIWMTFFGEPRTEAAENASEHDSVFAWMTTPLMVLAVFAVAGGWVGIPRTFPGLGALSSNPFEHFIGGLAEALEIPVHELEFNAVPLLTSLVVALGGLALGYVVYRGFRSVKQSDPLQKPLGPLYPVLQNKYYFDELYHAVVVKGLQRLSAWLFRFDDSWIIDPLVDGVGKLGKAISEIGRWIDTNVVDGAVNGAGAIADAAGGAVRVIQTGKAQNYLLVALVSISVLLGAFLLLPK